MPGLDAPPMLMKTAMQQRNSAASTWQEIYNAVSQTGKLGNSILIAWLLQWYFDSPLRPSWTQCAGGSSDREPA
jgi:hypothetical protein